MQFKNASLTLRSDDAPLTAEDFLALVKTSAMLRRLGVPGLRPSGVVSEVIAEAKVELGAGDADAVVIQLVGRNGSVFHLFESTVQIDGQDVVVPTFPVSGELSASATIPRRDLDEDASIDEWTTHAVRLTGEVIDIGGFEINVAEEARKTRVREAPDFLKLQVLLVKDGVVAEVGQSALVKVPGTVAAPTPLNFS